MEPGAPPVEGEREHAHVQMGERPPAAPGVVQSDVPEGLRLPPVQQSSTSGYQPQGVSMVQGPYGPQPAAAHLVTVDGKAQILVVESGPESSPESIVATCPRCNFTGETDCVKEAGGAYSGWCCVSCLFLGLVGMGCFVFFCGHNCKDAIHFCKRCHSVVGVYERPMCD